MTTSGQLKKQLNDVVEASYKAVNERMQELWSQNKGRLEDNDEHGRVYIVELKDPLWIKRFKEVRGVAKKGHALFLYIQDTGSKEGRLSGADYLISFLEVPELTTHMTIRILEALEQV